MVAVERYTQSKYTQRHFFSIQPLFLIEPHLPWQLLDLIVPSKLSTDRDLNGIVKNYTGTKYCEIYREASPQTADDIRDPCIEFSI